MRVFIVVVLIALLVPTASAHARLDQSSPSPGSTVEQGPTEVWIEFNEPVERSSVLLEVFQRPNNTRVDVPTTLVIHDTGARVSLSINTSLSAAYVAKWQALSTVDGHTSSGAWAFAVGDAAVPEAAPPTVAPFPWLTAVGKGLNFVGLALAAGFLVVRLWLLQLPPRYLPYWVQVTAVVGLGMTIAGVLVWARTQADAVGHDLLSYLYFTDFGNGLGLRMLIAVAAMIALAVDVKVNRRLTGVVVAVVFVALVVVGSAFSHSASLGPSRPVGTVIDALHVLAAAAWTGGLMLLLALLRAGNMPTLFQSSLRFSRLAQVCIIVLTLTGLGMVVTVLGTDPSVWASYARTRYGAVLAYKVLLAIVMMGLGAANHVLFVRRLQHGQPLSSPGLFQANVRREAVNGLLVLILAALLTNLAPPA